MNELGITIIVDVGAAGGYWSLSAKQFWPLANYVLFEPLEERKERLQSLAASEKRFHFVPLAAGNGKGSVSFKVTGDLDGNGVTDGQSPDARVIGVSSVQEEIERLKLTGPFLVKLDTHGFEIPILEGCERILGDVQVFIIECYGFYIAKDSLLFGEMCGYMDSIGFRLWDIVDIMRRPKDNAFWQCDAFFIRKENTVFAVNGYS